MTKTRVLIVDDSGFSRSILSKGLALSPDIDVVGSACNPIEAQVQIKRLKPDVLTLDVNMPEMNGIEFLHKLMPENPLPVVMVSSFTNKSSQITIDALMAGAVDFVQKPKMGTYDNLSDMISEIQSKIKIAAQVNTKEKFKEKAIQINSGLGTTYIPQNNKIIVMGASTGGVEAITFIVKQLHPLCPGIVIVQHMPAEFTKMFAKRLDTLTPFDVSEAKNWGQILPGKIYIAPGDKHVETQKLGSGYVTKLVSGKPVNGHIPSVDVLFRSAAKYARSHVIGIMLTGMGNDGAAAMLEMKNAGAKNIIQDEESSVVFGMPGAAYKLGAAKKLTPLSKIPAAIDYYLKERTNAK